MIQTAKKKAQIEEKDRLEALKADYVTTFGAKCGPGGESVLRDLYMEGGVMTTSFVPGDPYQTAFNEGTRAVAIHILEMTFGVKGMPLKIQEIEQDYQKENAA